MAAFRITRPALPLLVEIILGIAVAVFGVTRVIVIGSDQAVAAISIALAMGLALAAHRTAPLLALGLVWFSGVAQVLAGLDIAFVQLVVLVVAYGCSRYGRRATVVLSAVSIPLGASAGILYALSRGIGPASEAYIQQLLDLVMSATNVGVYGETSSLVVGLVIVVALLAVPWTLGLVVRLRVTGQRAVEERLRAEAETLRVTQLVELRETQARLARDVHDVVGHSLAIIVAQADSTQTMGDDEPDRMRAALSNIAATARASLGEVRGVLSDDPAPPRGASAGGLESLIENVRAGGTEVDLRLRGTARPLPPELDVVAYRTLQELLTNSLKHGSGALAVELDWRDYELAVTVRNGFLGEPGPGARSGLSGVRGRLDAVGGTFDTAGADGFWTAIARIPFVGRALPREVHA